MIAAFRPVSDGLHDGVGSEAAVMPAASDLVTRIDGLMGDRPVIRGTRITVAAVRGRVSGGDTLDDLMEDYPGVEREASEAALSYRETGDGGRSVSAGERQDM